MLTLSILECSCPYGVENGNIKVGWVGECCSELDTPVAIPYLDIKKCFCWDILGCC